MSEELSADDLLAKMEAAMPPDTRTQEEKDAEYAAYKASCINALVPLENIDTNGHSFIHGKMPWDDTDLGYDPSKEVKVWGNRDPADETHIFVTGTSMTCGGCGAFMRPTYDEATNSLSYIGESFEYGPMPEIGMERPSYDEWGSVEWTKFQELQHEAQIAHMATRRSIIHNGPCEYDPEMETVVRINVPSGKLIVDDDLRDTYSPDTNGCGDYNTPIGQANVVKLNAEHGCAYFPVGNSCPSVYRRPDGTYVIGSPAWDEETDDFSTADGWTELAGVCTDLWAASLADYDDYLLKGGKPVEQVKDEPGGWTRNVIEVEPGTYEFRFYGGRRDFDDMANGSTIYVDFHKVEE